LDESVRIAGEDANARARNDNDNDNDDSERIDRVAEIVGIAAVKYADLSMKRESNYQFSYEHILSLNGKKAPCMLYAYARICGIIRKASVQEEDAGETSLQWPQAAEILISDDAELELIRNLVRLPNVLSEVESVFNPARCVRIFDTSQSSARYVH
jgi:arginyl-tRNA synthetase